LAGVFNIRGNKREAEGEKRESNKARSPRGMGAGLSSRRGSRKKYTATIGMRTQRKNASGLEKKPREPVLGGGRAVGDDIVEPS